MISVVTDFFFFLSSLPDFPAKSRRSCCYSDLVKFNQYFLKAHLGQGAVVLTQENNKTSSRLQSHRLDNTQRVVNTSMTMIQKLTE